MKSILLVGLSLFTLNLSSQIFISEPREVLAQDESSISNPRITINANNEPVILYGKSGSYLKTTTLSNGVFSIPQLVAETNVMNGATYGADIKSYGSNVFISFSTTSGTAHFIQSNDNGQNWSDPVVAADPVGKFCEYAKLGINSNGQPRIITIISNDDYTEPLQTVVKSDDNGANWDFVSVHESINNAVPCECCQGEFISNNNYETVLYRGNDNDLRDIAVAVSTDGSNSFPTNELIDNQNWGINACPVTGPEAYINDNNLLTSVWMSKGNGRNRVWSGTLDLDNNLVGDNVVLDNSVGQNVVQNYPSIAGDNNDNLGIVWEDNRYTFKHIFFQYTSSGLDNLSETFVISDTSLTGFNQSPQIVMDQSGVYHVIYKKGSNLQYVQISTLTSLNQINANELSISPNPANTSTIVKGNFDLLEVFQLNGQKVMETTDNLIDVSNLSKGIYLVKMTNKHEVSSQKLVVQ